MKEKEKKHLLPKNKNERQNKRKNAFLITFICIFLALVLIFGAVLGIVTAVENANAVVKYEGLTMDKETASFFVTYYKYRYTLDLGVLGVQTLDHIP